MINFSQSIYTDMRYRHYIAEYYGDVVKSAGSNEDFYISIINSKYAIISADKHMPFNELKLKVGEVIQYIERPNIYTLEAINPIEAAEISQIQNFESLSLTGEGVLIGTVDTGINYLNKEFMDIDGNTRVECIWDQTILNNTDIKKIDIRTPFGTVYTEEEINTAIKIYNEEGDYKKIVPSEDDYGHGTKMASIIGGSGVDPILKGGAPKCKFVAVKLLEAIEIKEELDIKIAAYDLYSIFTAIDFLVQYAIKKNKPIVIYLPVGTNLSNHKGDTLLERYIDDISVNKGIVFITGSGNEGDTRCHTSGLISGAGESKDIMLYIDPIQKKIVVQVWVSNPNAMSLNIISPSGEETGVIPAFFNISETFKFVFENTVVTVDYYIPEESSGDQLAELYFVNIQPGTWKIRLTGEYILDGRFDSWITQRGVTLGETKFIYSDPYGTLTSPGPSSYILNVANYDQTTNYIVNSSGRTFEGDVSERIDIAAGGVNVVTTNVDGDGYSIVNGTSVSAAVVAGACALLLQWGIVNGNNPDMYSQKIKTFIVRGVQKREGDIYPNEEFGYGILDMVGVFRNMT